MDIYFYPYDGSDRRDTILTSYSNILIKGSWFFHKTYFRRICKGFS